MAQKTSKVAPWATVDYFYDTAKTIAAIQQHQFKRVALQFPDRFLSDATAVTNLLQAGAGDSVRFFTLGDTSYGSVHVD